MTAVSPMVLLLLAVAALVAVAAVLVATGRLGDGITLPRRTPIRPSPQAPERGRRGHGRRSRRSRSQDLR
ncbi:hypothetical protein JOD52_000881 [Brachybacterium muris]|nr:hypothetical protein [Brachybacterium muris]